MTGCHGQIFKWIGRSGRRWGRCLVHQRMWTENIGEMFIKCIIIRLEWLNAFHPFHCSFSYSTLYISIIMFILYIFYMYHLFLFFIFKPLERIMNNLTLKFTICFTLKFIFNFIKKKYLILFCIISYLLKVGNILFLGNVL